MRPDSATGTGHRRKRAIVAFAPHPWDDGPWMNRQNLMAGLAQRGWPVVYSYGPLDFWMRDGPVWKEAKLFGNIKTMDGVSVDRPGRWMPRWRTWPAWDRKAIRAHAARLRKAAKVSSGEDPIAFFFHPGFFPYVEGLKPAAVAFHVYDVYSQMETWTKEDQALLEQLVNRADLITAATSGMARTLPCDAFGRTRILPNGVDLSLFDYSRGVPPCPADLEKIPHPRIGNTGALNRKMDFRLIADVAAKRPDWQWVLVGPLHEEELLKDSEARAGLAACRERSNIHFLGARERHEIPAYVHHMDVNTVCYRIRKGEWVEAGYPVKLNEYLASGKPVVAAPQEAVVQFFADVVAIASDAKGWVSAIERAVSSGGVGTVEERENKAAENTWQKRVDQLEQWLLELP